MKLFFKKLFKQNKKLFLCLICLDSLVLLIHLLFSKYNNFFHLDFEQNLPTYYQSFKLIIFGLLFFMACFSKLLKGNLRSFMLSLSIFLIYLGLDELLQIHENIYRVFEYFDLFHPSRIVEASIKLGYRSSLWILYYLPFILIFGFWCGYWLRYFQSQMKDNFWILALSGFSLFTILSAEVFSSTGALNENTYFWLVTIEETAEMLLASTLILVGSKVINKTKH